MTYTYKCLNINCNLRNEIQEINKPISECSTKEYCKECNQELQKVFNSPGIKPANDKYKS